MTRTLLNTDIVHLAETIKQYLFKHPHAADTLQGVMNWWLLRERYEIAIDLVQEALEVLIQHEVVTKINLHGSEPIYKLRDNHCPNNLADQQSNPLV